MATVACLDTRIYFAHALEKYPWMDRIPSQARFPSSRIVSSTVTIAELLSNMGAKIGLETVQLRVRSAKNHGVEFVPPTEDIASRAGEIALRVRDLPLADAIIAATALELVHGRVFTDDPHFAGIPGIQCSWGQS